MNRKSYPKIGRYILIAWLVPVFYLPGLNQFLELIPRGTQWFWYDLFSIFYHHALFVLVLVILFFVHRIDWHPMFGRFNKADLPYAVELTAIIFIFSIAAAYALFYPLSYIHTGFVKYWFIDLPPVIYSESGQYPLLPNFLSFISVVVLAPVIEEFAFRGLLLPRWNEKWGLKKAIIISSILFGMVHPDPIGATAFGIAMCVLYLKTGTLMVPIICHALNNLLVWLVQAGYFIAYGSGFYYTLERFRDEWPIGVICGVVFIVWGRDFMKKTKTQGLWQLPEV